MEQMNEKAFDEKPRSNSFGGSTPVVTTNLNDVKKPAFFMNEEYDMYVTKRNGKIEPVSFDKILKRIKSISSSTAITSIPEEQKKGDLGKSLKIHHTNLAMKVIDQLYNKISTNKIDELTAEQCATMASIHPDYNILASRVIISNHHRDTPTTFSKSMNILYKCKNKHGKQLSLITDEFYYFVHKKSSQLDAVCGDCRKDYLLDYFGFKTLEKSYLMKVNGKIVERPQYMWLRVAIGIHLPSNKNQIANLGELKEQELINKIIETYEFMSNKYFTHATPTLFNAGTPHPQLSSCFLESMESDSIEGIYNTLKDCALISKWAGGIGLHIHNIRASGSHISGTNGTSNGIVPMLKVFNNTARYVDQCLIPETIVYTKNGIKNAKNVVVGDKVITKNGEFSKVGKILNYNYIGDLYSLKFCDDTFPITLTEFHPVWTIPIEHKNDSISFENLMRSLKMKLIVPEFIEAKNICAGDFVGFPIPKYEKDIPQYTEEDCRFYGILLANKLKTSFNGTTFELSFNKKKQSETISFMEHYFNKRFIRFTVYEEEIEEFVENNVYEDANIHDMYNEYDTYTCVNMSWHSTNENKFTKEMIFENFNENEKYMMNSMLHLPKNKLLQIIKGYVEKGNVIFSKSIRLLENFKYMFLRLGSLSFEKMSKTNNFTLDIPKNVIAMICNKPNFETNDFFVFDDIVYTKINEVDVENKHSERVIDFEIDTEDDEKHNYLTHGGLVHNGGGKRNGSFAIYLEPWHSDIELFLQMRKNHGDEEMKARDLFYALWIPDLFMERVKTGGTWTLMCPDECPGLSNVHSQEFNKLYVQYETEGKGRKTMDARDLWFQILDSQMETGTPYLLYKDSANRKSNQKNLGTIKSSNLCTEIIEYSDSNETAVCNLASIALPSFVEDGIFNYEKLHKVSKIVTYNLNRVIDVNYYPIEKTKISNFKHRPIGIGVQGLADVFMLLNIPFLSEEAKKINCDIFETIYHAALEESNELAVKEGPYETFAGSPASQGLLQFDLWNKTPTSERYDWNELKEQIKKNGLRNSLLIAPMPTASTSQILGFNECFEPITSNIYSRRTLAGEFIIANKYLMNDLIKLDLWNEKIKNNIIANNGSIQQLDFIPEHIRNKYRTVWEIPMRHLIDMSADRGIYICQSQSLNLWLEDPNYNNLTSMHFYAWSKGLKTGIYYLRRRAKHQAQQFTIEPEKKKDVYSNNDEICEMCSS